MFSEVLTFTSSSSSDSVTVTIRDDTDVEGLENFVASLSVNAALNPGVRVEPASADITIRDNDGNILMYLCMHSGFWLTATCRPAKS